MKYKTEKIEGTKACPEWLAEAMVKGEAVLCETSVGGGMTLITGYDINTEQYQSEYGHTYYNVTPIAYWEPQEGEVVLAWDDKDTATYPLIFDSISGNKIWGMFQCTDMDPKGVGLSCFSNMTKFSIELYTKPISEWPKDIEIISVEPKEDKENTW